MSTRLFPEWGSEFHWSGIPEAPFLAWTQPHTWFASGRDALLAIWRQRQNSLPAATLFVPDYFCADITAHWRTAGISVALYADDPRWPVPDWASLTPQPGDMVLAMNYFGVRDMQAWYDWHRQHDAVILVEDHSHDPVAHAALHSQADYAFASVRKTFPVPDGAILWSPRQHALPPEPEGTNWSASGLKLAAMLWKREYLDQPVPDPHLKQVFRSLQVAGETDLAASAQQRIAPWSRALVAQGVPLAWRRQRAHNVQHFLEQIAGQSFVTPLFRQWPAGHCPFGAILVCATPAHRDLLRARLIEAAIYVAVHWPQESDASERARSLAQRILTIPMDQRYDAQDVQHMASVVQRIGHEARAETITEPEPKRSSA
jgi:hypothetical protein